mmetsp:Transcript_62388/g.147865  ORF Transcript_62388/g.147865 Transcript_62388/m.147865 type:complete len:105 (-) Transcript_62388:36-350(-)
MSIMQWRHVRPPPREGPPSEAAAEEEEQRRPVAPAQGDLGAAVEAIGAHLDAAHDLAARFSELAPLARGLQMLIQAIDEDPDPREQLSSPPLMSRAEGDDLLSP